MPDDPTPTPAPEPAPAPDPAPAPEPDRAFSQADLDRIVRERLARQAKQYEGYDELKVKAEEFDKLQAANQTELEKANARAAKLEREAEEQRIRAREITTRSAIVAEAAKRQLVDPDAAVALIDRASLEVDGEGTPTNIAEAMDSLLEAKPYLAGGGSRGNADQGARGGDGVKQLSRDALKNMNPQEIVAARREGKLNQLLTGGS